MGFLETFVPEGKIPPPERDMVVLKKLNQLESMLHHERMRRSAIDTEVDHILRSFKKSGASKSKRRPKLFIRPDTAPRNVRTLKRLPKTAYKSPAAVGYVCVRVNAKAA